MPLSTIPNIAVAGLIHDHVWNELPHWQTLAASNPPRANLVAVSDTHKHLLHRAVTEYQFTRSYQDSLDMLNDASLHIDILAITTDNASHAPLVRATLSRSPSPPTVIIVEKPMASTLQDAVEMFDSCESKGVLLLVNWPNWKNPVWRELIKRVRMGQVGEVRHAEFRGGHAGPRAFGCSREFVEWLYDEKRNGAGAFIDYLGYSTSLFSHILPSSLPQSITAHRLLLSPQQNPGASDDTAHIFLTYADAVAVGQGSWLQVSPALGVNPVIYGTKGGIGIQEGKLVVVGPSGVRETDKSNYGKEGLATDFAISLIPEHLANAPNLAVWAFHNNKEKVKEVVEGELVSARVGLRAQMMLQGGLVSAKEGRTVEWREVEGLRRGEVGSKV